MRPVPNISSMLEHCNNSIVQSINGIQMQLSPMGKWVNYMQLSDSKMRSKLDKLVNEVHY